MAVFNFTRLQDLIDRGALKGKRVFIRADLNVPQDDAGNITEDTRVRASVPAIRAALDAGAAVMVTSHLGRPTEGEFKPEDSLAPVAQRLSELLGQPVEAEAGLGRWRRCGAGPGRAAGKLPRQQGRKEERRRPGPEDGQAVRRLRQRRLRHRAPRRSHHPRHREVRAGGRRRPADGRRTGRAGQGAGHSRSVRCWPSSPARRSRPSCRSCKAWPTRSTT